MKRIFLGLRKMSWSILLPVLLLLGLSALLLYSLGANRVVPNLALFGRHVQFIVMGLTCMVIIALMDYRRLRQYIWIFFALSLVLQLLVAVIGDTVGGNRNWLSIFGQRFQPVEFVKICTALYLAEYFAHYDKALRSLRQLVIPILIVILPFGLVMLGGDLGSALVLLSILVFGLFFAGVRARHLLLMSFIGLSVAVFAWFTVLTPTQKSRISVFLQPNVDPFGVSYQVRQSVIAIGSGGVWGKGFGLGSQSQLNFLPVQETDFIFAVAAEEFGFIGVSLILLLYLVLLTQLLRASRKTHDRFANVYLGIFFGIILMQVMVNVGMNLRVAPVTGIPLPLLSYGGSALLSTCVGLGFALSMYRYRSVTLDR